MTERGEDCSVWMSHKINIEMKENCVKLKNNLSTRINVRVTTSEFSCYGSWNEAFTCYIGDLKIQLKLFINGNPQGSHHSKQMLKWNDPSETINFPSLTFEDKDSIDLHRIFQNFPRKCFFSFSINFCTRMENKIIELLCVIYFDNKLQMTWNFWGT